jgi:sugar lactone lactonase YvrE
MRRLEITHFSALGCRLGEGPLWHPFEERLYGVDIEGRSIWRINPNYGSSEQYAAHALVGCLGIRDLGGFVLAYQHGFAFWSPTDGDLLPIHDPETDRPLARFNDGAIDPGGRFWAGTMTADGFENSLYRLDPDLRVHKMETAIGISNGIGWSPDRSTMYLTDSPRKIIYAYDYEVETGGIVNRRVWVDSQEESGVPDGLCVDSEGCVWSARWDGWRISRYDPQGQLMFEVSTPVQRPTSCAFGGTDLQTLFITSAWSGLTNSERQAQPLAGDIFVVESDFSGQEPNLFKG